MKRRNLIFTTDNSVNVDKNMKILAQENHDADIWLGILEKDDEIKEYTKRKEYDIENIRNNNNNNETTTRRNLAPRSISNSIPRIIMPAVTTVVVASIGVLPGINGIDSLNVFKGLQSNNEVTITSNIDEKESNEIVFNFKVLDGTQTMEVDNFAITRTDNNQKIDSNRIAPGTSGEFIIEMDTTRKECSTRV